MQNGLFSCLLLQNCHLHEVLVRRKMIERQNDEDELAKPDAAMCFCCTFMKAKSLN